MVEFFDNIRKLYTFKSPCPELADQVEFFSETSLDATHQYIQTASFTVKLFPSYTPTIWINLGSPYHLKNGDKTYLIDEGTDILLLRNEIVERINLPTDNIFTVKFNPGGFEAVFGISQTTIGSNIINVTDLIPASAIQKLKRLGSFEDRMTLLQNLLLEKLEKQKDTHYLQCVQQCIDVFCKSGMVSSNNELAKKLCITDKTLYRYFSQVIGTNPKNYFATVRARTALTAYVADSTGFSPYDHGYYDMSHFYKDVQKFTGRKLSSFHWG